MPARLSSRLGLPCLSVILSVTAVAQSSVQTVEQQAYLKASNPGEEDFFGFSVAISGDTVVVGASFEDSSATGVNGEEDSEGALNSGAAYVFVREGSTWSQQAYLKASNTDAFDSFGYSVAISGDTLVVGAVNEASKADLVNGDQFNNGAPLAGAAYVFVRNGTTWTQQAYLKASNAEAGDFFGESVALSGDTLAVGSVLEDSGILGGQADNSAVNSGAVYVFVRTGTTWSQEAYLKASNIDVQDGFGGNLALEADTLVVGAAGEDSAIAGVDGDQSDNNALNSGAAFVFERNGSNWTQTSYLKASNAGAGDAFGWSTALSNETLVISAFQEASHFDQDESDNSAPGSGAAYVFARSGSGWVQEGYLKASNAGAGDQFGFCVSLAGESIVVGAPFEASNALGIDGDQGNNTAPTSGAAYWFERNAGGWTQRSYVKASNTDSADPFGNNDSFGRSVAVSGTMFVAGAYREDSGANGANGDQVDNGQSNAGAAYVFDLDVEVPLPPVGTDLCSGDGGDQMGCTDCPCQNNAPPGTIGGCLSSSATSARLLVSGSTSVSLPPQADNDLRFAMTNARVGAFSILVSGDSVAPTTLLSPCFGLSSGIQAIAYDGLRCAVGNVRLHGGRVTDSSGEIGSTGSPWGGEGDPVLGLLQGSDVFIAGHTRYFQVLYRDNPLLSCLRGLNTSQAVEITFTP